MRDPILDLAQLPSCRMLLTPSGWWSPLKPGVVWPGAPRNFATEPATWSDFAYRVAQMKSTDWSFEIEYDLKSLTTGELFSGLNGNGAAVSIFVSGYLYIRTFTNNRLFAMTIADASALGKHTIRFSFRGTVCTRYYDGVAVSFDYGESAVPVFSYVPLSRADVTINHMKFTCGDVVWSYPSYAERLRLITGTNVLNTGTHWEAANPAVAARIDTALDLRGVVSNYTNVVDFEAETLLNGQMQSLAGQGPGTAGQLTICVMVCLRDNLGFYKIQLAHEIAGVRRLLLAPIGQLVGRHVLTSRVSVSIATTTLFLYLDGVLLASQEFAGIPTETASSTYVNFAIGNTGNISYVNVFGKIYAAALFNEALTDDQIAYASK